MVATKDCVEKAKPTAGNKVSKPLMEKKRRARINQCLDQLKSLLESYYSSSIRKRKLEKADILELTVKHLKNLQKIQSCAASSFDVSDYQTGFRSCLANVNQYLLMTDNLNGSDRWMLSQLSSKLCRSRRRGEISRTMDSGLEHPETQHEAQKVLPSVSGTEEKKTTRSETLKVHSASTSPFPPTEESRRLPETKQAVFSAAPTQNTNKKSFIHINEGASTQNSVWRPW
ncbi:hairy-related 3 [Archocentrus centrarchus]|uniref:hairy-related 3 n=1 Tax=Archocentrus centrarchus TaxID=63155 RepID=UPI0011E9F6FD|nr:transcription factor HES-3-like [Archocentrus centrarchus]